MSDLPEPPVNVRAQLYDGSVVPVECYYDGVDEESGSARWVSVRRHDFISVSIDMLPANTMVLVRTTGDDDD